ncbi:MAG: rod shape-determining protein MreC [Patescibacteria group bacterium]|jgi:rod shape-determining protein MreC
MIKIRRNKTFLTVIVVLGLLFFLHGVKILSPLENFLLSLTKPFSGHLYSLGNSFNQSYSRSRDKTDLNLKVDDLNREIARLTVNQASCQEIESENQKLHNQLKFLSDHNFKAVVANVLAKEALAETGEQSQDFIIDKGSRNGLRVGLGVVSEEGVIVGQVIEIKENTAKICLTTSSGCKLAGAILNQTKTQGLTDGDLGLTIKMNYIPQLEKISPNDIVITSGLGGNIPRGLVIGKITQVKNESNEVWQAATIEPLINFNNLTVVSVIIP